LLEVRNINVSYGLAKVLWDVSFRVEEREIVAIVGSNGAGKSTTLKAISGLIRLSSGGIEFNGERLDQIPGYLIVEKQIAHIPEGRRLFPFSTVLANLELGAFTKKARHKFGESLHYVFELFPVLQERKDQLAGTLSGGEQQMLAIARGLMSIPLLLMLDEPSLGLAPMLVIKTLDVLQKLNQQGLTLLLIEQNVHSALNLCARGYVLENGRIMIEGSGQELLNNTHVKEAYLGIL
jgi:branched-chain amino acid transport system ATP-binding protein